LIEQREVARLSVAELLPERPQPPGFLREGGLRIRFTAADLKRKGSGSTAIAV
jgi:hypothetical protein